MRYLNGLFTDGRWAWAHWTVIAFLVVLGWFLIGIGHVDIMATEGMIALFTALGLAWIAGLTVAVITLLRRTRATLLAIERFETLTYGSAQTDAEQSLRRDNIPAQAAGRAGLRSQ